MYKLRLTIRDVLLWLACWIGNGIDIGIKPTDWETTTGVSYTRFCMFYPLQENIIINYDNRKVYSVNK